MTNHLNGRLQYCCKYIGSTHTQVVGRWYALFKRPTMLCFHCYQLIWLECCCCCCWCCDRGGDDWMSKCSRSDGHCISIRYGLFFHFSFVYQRNSSNSLFLSLAAFPIFHFIGAIACGFSLHRSDLVHFSFTRYRS